MINKILIASLLCFFSCKNISFAQEKKLSLWSFQSADTLDKKRVRGMTVLGTSCYAGMFTLLSQTWYSKYDKTKFHLFNDNHEWEQMDKVGHVFGGYFESRWFAQAYQWAGVKQRRSAYIGAAAGTLIQGTLEFSDGFSKKWGFSMGDIAANTTGTLLFLGQELAWKEQRFVMKVSNTPQKYSDEIIFSQDGLYSMPLSTRAHNLLGNNYIVSFLKDYNAQTLWLSGNIHSFFPQSRVPKWLNVAVGYGANNLYVGDKKYAWTQENAANGIPAGTIFPFDAVKYPRYRQVYLSLDIDLTRIKTKSHFWNTVLHGINVIKIPAPALEFNGLGKVKFHPIYF
jgi:Predicted periplasmic lipoprotein (DUF2279)